MNETNITAYTEKAVNSAKNAIKALKLEANTLAQVLKVLYDIRERAEVKFFASQLFHIDASTKKMAVAGALKLVANKYPYISKDGEKIVYLKPKKVAKNIAQLEATTNVWEILKILFTALENGNTQTTASVSDYINTTSGKIMEKSEGEAAYNAAKVESEKRANEKANKKLKKALEKLLSDAEGLTAEYIQKAINSID